MSSIHKSAEELPPDLIHAIQEFNHLYTLCLEGKYSIIDLWSRKGGLSRLLESIRSKFTEYDVLEKDRSDIINILTSTSILISKIPSSAHVGSLDFDDKEGGGAEKKILTNYLWCKDYFARFAGSGDHVGLRTKLSEGSIRTDGRSDMREKLVCDFYQLVDSMLDMKDSVAEFMLYYAEANTTNQRLLKMLVPKFDTQCDMLKDDFTRLISRIGTFGIKFDGSISSDTFEHIEKLRFGLDARRQDLKQAHSDLLKNEITVREFWEKKGGLLESLTSLKAKAGDYALGDNDIQNIDGLITSIPPLLSHLKSGDFNLMEENDKMKLEAQIRMLESKGMTLFERFFTGSWEQQKDSLKASMDSSLTQVRRQLRNLWRNNITDILNG
jgi:hypothetical protein